MSKVRLQDIQTLYLFQDAETKARRSSPIPQLTCEGKLCKKFQPSSVTCSNIGGSGQDVVWKVWVPSYSACVAIDMHIRMHSAKQTYQAHSALARSMSHVKVGEAPAINIFLRVGFE
jgi:hypothetical protein